jgi:predicted GNAT family N-acyltransferase
MELRFQDLSREFAREAFDCEVKSLNDFLTHYALQYQKKGISVTTVVTSDEDSRAILGYYSVSMAHVDFGSLTSEQAKGLPQHPAPAMLIGRLAVDKSAKGNGIGSELLRHALLKALRLSKEVGCCFVLVDALEVATGFYAQFGFVPLADKPLSMVISVNSIKK